MLLWLSRPTCNALFLQVLVLGAGFDTAWFQLQQDMPDVLPAKYLEVDFKEVCVHACVNVCVIPSRSVCVFVCASVCVCVPLRLTNDRYQSRDAKHNTHA